MGMDTRNECIQDGILLLLLCCWSMCHAEQGTDAIDEGIELFVLMKYKIRIPHEDSTSGDGHGFIEFV